MARETMDTYETALEQEMARAGVTVLSTGTYQVPSSSRPGQHYVVTYAGRGDEAEVALWDCTCPSRRTCKHINLVSGIVNNLNDEFGYE